MRHIILALSCMFLFLLIIGTQAQANQKRLILPSLPTTHAWLSVVETTTVPPEGRWLNNVDFWDINTYLDTQYGLIKDFNPSSVVTRTVETYSATEGIEYIEVNDMLTFIIHVYSNPLEAALTQSPRTFAIITYKVVEH